jgi:hypothetical protein
LNGDGISWMTCSFFKTILEKTPIVLRSGGGGRARSEKKSGGPQNKTEYIFPN